MDLHSKMTMYVTRTMTSPVTKTAKTSKWLRLHLAQFPHLPKNCNCGIRVRGNHLHTKFLNARFEYNDIVNFIYSHYPLDLNAKSSDTRGKTFGIR